MKYPDLQYLCDELNVYVTNCIYFFKNHLKQPKIHKYFCS